MFKNLRFFALAVAALFFWPLSAVLADTSISTGSIMSPVWTPENSPYIINGTLEIASGATLKIQPGTEVRFNSGAKLLVKGELQVLGTVSDPVMLTLNTASSTAARWGGIEFADSSTDANFSNDTYQSGSIIQNAIIKFSEGIKCDDASPYIANNQFLNNTVGVNVVGTTGSAGGMVMDTTSSSSNASKLKTIRIYNNTFSDSGIGIIINRNNGQDYIVTPVGYDYLGNQLATSYLDKNTISGSTVGIQVTNGDGNVITNNTIRYNSGAALTLAAASRSNAVQNNDLNNNAFGIVSASNASFIAQNNIKNNSDTGVVITQKPLLLAYNNIYNNKKYNLSNSVYNLDAAKNYWGSADSAAVASSFLTAIASTSTTVTYPVLYSDFLKQEDSLSNIISPLLDSAETPTIAEKTTISGIKPAGTSVYINSNLLDMNRDALTWSYRDNLRLGENSFQIYYKDAKGQTSDTKIVSIVRVESLSDPTVNAYNYTTTASTTELSGTKPAGSSLSLNGQEIIPASSATTWNYFLTLNMGVNTAEISAYDPNTKQTSNAVSISVTRKADTSGEVIAAEKKASKTVDKKLVAQVSGRLLLQVENKGYIWYVNIKDGKRYLVTIDNALELFRNFSLGISEENLDKIPTKGSTNKGNAALRKRLAGQFMLRVQKSGMISYIDLDGYRHDITQVGLMDIFRSLSLGISNANIYKIPVGELTAK